MEDFYRNKANNTYVLVQSVRIINQTRKFAISSLKRLCQTTEDHVRCQNEKYRENKISRIFSIYY